MNNITATQGNTQGILKDNESEVYYFPTNKNDVEVEFANNYLVVKTKGKKNPLKESIIQDIIKAKTPEDVDKIFNDIIFDQQKIRLIFDEYKRKTKSTIYPNIP